MALKALNSPAFGWVTTTLVACKTVPPPTGMSASLTTSLAEPAEPAAALSALPVGDAELLPPPHAARVAAPTTPTPATPTLRMRVRRSIPFVSRWLAVGSCSGGLTSPPELGVPVLLRPNVAEAPMVHLSKGTGATQVSPGWSHLPRFRPYFSPITKVSQVFRPITTRHRAGNDTATQLSERSHTSASRVSVPICRDITRGSGMLPGR